MVFSEMNMISKPHLYLYFFVLMKHQEHILFHQKKLILLQHLFEVFLTNNLSKALDVSDLIIQLFKNVNPPIKTSSLAGINVFQF